MIRVVNVQGMRTPERVAGLVYVGRACRGWAGHHFANPFKLGRIGACGSCQQVMRALQEKLRNECLDKYRAWLMERPTLEQDLAGLWDATKQGELPLGCWCHPLPCHADILAEELSRRFA